MIVDSVLPKFSPTVSTRKLVARILVALLAIFAATDASISKSLGDEALPTTHPTGRLLLCGMDEIFEITVPASDGAMIRKEWSWRANQCLEIPEAIRNQFRTTDECKAIDEDRVLITSSGGGCALIERSTGKAIWFASVPNAHSIEALPGNRVVVASSVATEGNRLVLFDLAQSETALWQTPLISAHGLVWDDSRQTLWAIGMDTLESYSLMNWDSQAPTMEKQASYPLPNEGGHDLQPVPQSDDLVLSTHEHVYLFDRENHLFRPHPELHDKKNVKCVSVQSADGPTVWLQGDADTWWTQTLHFLSPAAKQSLPEEKLYKARWLTSPE